MKIKHQKRDNQILEFERRDLGQDIERSKSSKVIHPKHRSMPTSILLDPSMISKLKGKAEGRGIGYQTMLKIILHEHVDEY